jgi:pyridoxal phosphate enzyme (YggS family)
MISFEEFERRVGSVLATVQEACARAKRDPSEVKLLPVTKTHPVAAVDFVARYGLPAVGENRVQEATEKRALTSAAVRWELIGHLQSNKARLAVEHFERVQSVDSEKLITLLDRAAAEKGKVLPILLQVNSGNDPAKFGVDLDQAPRLLDSALSKSHLRVDGFMAIAPLSSDLDAAVRTFENLRVLRDRLASEHKVPLHELSMGMSGDLVAAIAAGSTLIRVGTALFGKR